MGRDRLDKGSITQAAGPSCQNFLFLLSKDKLLCGMGIDCRCERGGLVGSLVDWLVCSLVGWVDSYMGRDRLTRDPSQELLVRCCILHKTDSLLPFTADIVQKKRSYINF